MQTRTLLFIGISALIHLGVLVLLTNTQKPLDLYEQGRSSIPVEILQQSTQHPILTKQEQTPSQTENNKHTTRQIKTDKPLLARQEASKSFTDTPLPLKPTESVKELKPRKQESKNLTVAQKTKTKAKKNLTEINITEVQSALISELTKYFYYPKAAQRKSWEGLVILSFTILPSGVINNIQVSSSSGYSALDNAAIDAVEKFNNHSALALALNGNTHIQQLPVTYKLTN